MAEHSWSCHLIRWLPEAESPTVNFAAFGVHLNISVALNFRLIRFIQTSSLSFVDNLCNFVVFILDILS